MAKKICATCGADIDTAKTGYIKCLDNFLQIKYFDSEKDNVFCSEECACKSLMIERVFEEEENTSEQEDLEEDY